MNFKTDKEDRSCDDIAFLFKIITNFVYGKLGHCLNPFNSELIPKNITKDAGKGYSINL